MNTFKKGTSRGTQAVLASAEKKSAPKKNSGLSRGIPASPLANLARSVVPESPNKPSVVLEPPPPMHQPPLLKRSAPKQARQPSAPPALPPNTPPSRLSKRTESSRLLNKMVPAKKKGAAADSASAVVAATATAVVQRGVAESPIVISEECVRDDDKGGDPPKEVRMEALFVDFGGERFRDATVTWREDRVVMTWERGDQQDVVILHDKIDGVFLIDKMLLVALHAVPEGDMARFSKMERNYLGSESQRRYVVIGAQNGEDYVRVRTLLQRTKALQQSVAEKAADWDAWGFYDRVAASARGSKRRKKGVAAEDNIVLRYPPNARDVVTVYEADVALLKQRQFLNDSVITFYIKYLQVAVVAAVGGMGLYHKDLNTVHIFSSHFYTKLAQGYDAVRNWAKNEDLFEKRFVLIPINEDLHWYLAIVAFDKENETAAILVLDSLGNTDRRSGVQLRVGNYLIDEWKAKKKTDVPKYIARIKTRWLAVPYQNNYCDCGVFLLHYIERFLLTDALECGWENVDLSAWFERKEIPEKRKEIKRIIDNLHAGVDSGIMRDTEARLKQFMKELGGDGVVLDREEGRMLGLFCENYGSLSIDNVGVAASPSLPIEREEMVEAGILEEEQFLPVESNKEKRLKKRHAAEAQILPPQVEVLPPRREPDPPLVEPQGSPAKVRSPALEVPAVPSVLSQLEAEPPVPLQTQDAATQRSSVVLVAAAKKKTYSRKNVVPEEEEPQIRLGKVLPRSSRVEETSPIGFFPAANKSKGRKGTIDLNEEDEVDAQPKRKGGRRQLELAGTSESISGGKSGGGGKKRIGETMANDKKKKRAPDVAEQLGAVRKRSPRLNGSRDKAADVDLVDDEHSRGAKGANSKRSPSIESTIRKPRVAHLVEDEIEASPQRLRSGRKRGGPVGRDARLELRNSRKRGYEPVDDPIV